MNVELPKNLLTLRQATALLNVHADTLRRWEKQGLLNSIRVGKRRDRRYSLSDLYKVAGVQPSALVTDKNMSEQAFLKVDMGPIRDLIQNCELIMIDVSETLMSLYPSRGEVYANIAYSFGFNLNPQVIEQCYIEQYDLWEKDKLFSEYGAIVSVKERNYLFKKLNVDTLIRAGIPIENSKEAEMIAEAIFLEVRENPVNWGLAPYALEFMESLIKRNKKIAIVDNWDNHLGIFVERSSFGKYVSLVVSGGELQHRKPDPYVFNYTVEKMGVTKERSIYIGNRYIDDVLGARNAGVMPVIYDPYRKFLNEDFLSFYRFRDLII